MKKKEKHLPINCIGKIIKEAREKQKLSIEDLSLKMDKPTVTPKLIKKWEAGKEFPDLDNIYLLARILDLNPNDLFNKRLRIQDESIHEVNPAKRRLENKIFNVMFVIVRQIVKWLAGICIIVVVANYKNFENKIGGQNDPEQIEFIEDIMINAINEHTNLNLVNNDKVVLKKKSENTNIQNDLIENTNIVGNIIVE